MTITIGYWIIPLVVTAAAFIIASRNDPRDTYGVGGAVNVALALIVSLVAWLIWAVLT